MELSLVYLTKSDKIKNAKLKIIQYLIGQGVLPDSIKISNQEFYFQCSPEVQKKPTEWCEELNSQFNGHINFLSKFPDEQILRPM